MMRSYFHSKLTFALETAFARKPLRFQVPEYDSGWTLLLESTALETISISVEEELTGS
jgi:hypothetical protein